MKLAIIAALCALAFATRTPSHTWEREFPQWDLKENAFRADREYQFKYNGQLATGIPGSSQQHSATRIQALVSLIFKTEETAILAIDRVRIGRLNRQIPNPRAMIPFMAFEETPIDSELQEKLMVPIKFTYSKGMISNVVFDGREEAWSANIKRGILNMLQVNLHRHGATDLAEEATTLNKIEKSETPEYDFYTVMENTLEGQCETLYTVTSQPDRLNYRYASPRFSNSPVLNVTKTINFEKCQKRPQIKYNFRFSDPCPSCDQKYTDDEKFLRSSTVAKYNITGTRDEFLIESAIVESQYTLVPFNRKENVVSTYVNQTLVLITSGPIKSRREEPRNPKPSDSHMIYTPDWDIAKELFFMKGEKEFLETTPYSEMKDKFAFVSTILRRLVSEMRESVKEEAPHQYVRLVKIFRMLTRSEMERIHETYFKSNPEGFTPEEHKKVQSLLIDALADAGTKDAVFHLVEKIRQRQIHPIRAALVIKSLINIRTVSKEMIDEMLRLAEHEVCQRNWFLKQSVYLTVGSMVNALCMANEDQWASEFKVRSDKFCPKAFKEQLVQKLFEKLRSAQKFQDKVLFLKTIGNMGLDVSVFELEKIIKNVEPHSTQVRVEAILALRQIREIMPRKVQKILMPVFMTRQEPTELRIAAVYQILQTLPERPILDQIARRMFSEHSRQVAAFVHSYMSTVSNSTNPCLKKFSQDLQLSLRHGQKIEYALHPGYSKFLHGSFHSETHKLGVDVNFQTIMSNYTSLPKMVAADVHGNFLGLWSKHLLTVGVAVKDLDTLLQKFLGSQGYWTELNLEDILIRSPRSIQTSSPLIELKNLWKKLKTVERSLPNTPEGYIYLKYKDQDFGMLPFSMESITESFGDMVSEGKLNFQQIERFLASGYNFKFYKGSMLHEMSYTIPTTLGMPLVASFKIPVVAQVTGQIRANFQPEKSLESVKIELNEVNPSFVSTVVSSVQIWSPIVNSGLKVLAIAKVHAPISGKVEIDLRREEPSLKITWQPPKESVNWLTLESRPITFTRVWPKYLTSWEEPEEKTVHGEEWTRQYNLRKDFPFVRKVEELSEKVLGLRMQLNGQWHHTPVKHVDGTPFSPLSGPNKISIQTTPSSDVPKEITLKLTGKVFSSFSESFRPNFHEFNLDTSSEDEERLQGNWRSYEPTRPWESVIKAELSTKGSNKELKAHLEAKLKCGERLRYCKLETVLERSRIPEVDSEPFKLRVEGEILYPDTPYRFSELTGKKLVSNLKITWGRTAESSSNHVTIKVQGDRSQEQRRMLQEDPEYAMYQNEERCKDKDLCSPVAVYTPLYEASKLMHYKVEIEHQNVPAVLKNITNKIFRAIKTYYYWNSEQAMVEVHNPQNKIKVDLFIDPRSKQYINVTVKTPVENVTFKDIPLPVKLQPFNIRRTQNIRSWTDVYRTVSTEVYPVCQLQSRRIKTFDGVEYQVPLSTCWSVLAKDCSSESNPSFAVLVRKVSSQSSQKKIKILTRSHKIELTPESLEYESIKVWVDGVEKNIRDSESIMRQNREIAQIEKSGQYVKVILPESDIRVYFDGYSVNIKMSPLFRNVQCGLCGHYDLETSDEFRNPEFELESDVRSFQQKYTVEEESCEYPRNLNQICSTSQCEYRRPSYNEKCQGEDEKQECRMELEDDDSSSDEDDSKERQERRNKNNESSNDSDSKDSDSKEQNKSQEDSNDDDDSKSNDSKEQQRRQERRQESREGSRHQRRYETEPIPRTKVIEQMAKICFSKNPIPTCPTHTYPTSYKPERKVVYSCLPRDDMQAELLLNKVVKERRIPSEISSLPTSFTEEEVVPESCSRL